MIVSTLCDYMQFRAALENTEWNLTQDFIQEHFDAGIRRFFGVTVSDNGAILDDVENPKALTTWSTLIAGICSRFNGTHQQLTPAPTAPTATPDIDYEETDEIVTDWYYDIYLGFDPTYPDREPLPEPYHTDPTSTDFLDEIVEEHICKYCGWVIGPTAASATPECDYEVDAEESELVWYETYANKIDPETIPDFNVDPRSADFLDELLEEDGMCPGCGRLSHNCWCFCRRCGMPDYHCHCC